MLRVGGHSFALLAGDEKERRVSGWAAVLGSLARQGSVVHRLQWVATSVPDDGRAVAAYAADRAVLPADSPVRRSYVALLAESGAATSRHQVLVVLQVRVGGTAARSIRAAGGGDRGAGAVLLREVALLRQRLGEADMFVEEVLGPRSLAAELRRAHEPSPTGGGGGGWPWPLATSEEWGRVRTDGTWHATYWVAEWPRVDVGPEFLGPLLLGPVRRSVSLVMAPIPPAEATRSVEQARTADLADAELRRRGGFLATARRGREAETVVRRESELADGHATYRYSGYVTVTAATPDLLDDACAATEQAAGQCRLELRRLYGDQLRALTCTLPLGRGLT